MGLNNEVFSILPDGTRRQHRLCFFVHFLCLRRVVHLLCQSFERFSRLHVMHNISHGLLAICWHGAVVCCTSHIALLRAGGWPVTEVGAFADRPVIGSSQHNSGRKEANNETGALMQTITAKFELRDYRCFHTFHLFVQVSKYRCVEGTAEQTADSNPAVRLVHHGMMRHCSCSVSRHSRNIPLSIPWHRHESQDTQMRVVLDRGFSGLDDASSSPRWSHLTPRNRFVQ